MIRGRAVFIEKSKGKIQTPYIEKPNIEITD